ncbi:hypothetical protein MVEN_01070400 [Mycena venus]|uniref:Uncharacterized protein n=1 Tax=Mycena venus TaxID=2733690 RepID=A0A8H7D058_9AGAR|nr:hypothetical protein MVEN_01070400 [Mycena venus]
MLTVPRIPSALATVVIETFFYGIYIVLFITSVYLLFTVQSRGLRRGSSIFLSPILCGGSVLFIAVTGHWVLTIDRLFLAFANVESGANPLLFYGDFSQVTQIAQSSFLLASLAIVDALFVHRLWTVWRHNPAVMVFPTLTLLGLVVSAVGVMYDFSQFKPGDSVDELANGWIIADCAFTVLTNIYCTSFIAWRLWRVQSILKPVGGRTLLSVLAIIVESAALSAAWAIFFILTYVVRSNLRFLVDVTPAIVGTTNMLIYVRVGMGWAHSPSPTAPSTAIRFTEGGYGLTIANYRCQRPCSALPALTLFDVLLST